MRAIAKLLFFFVGTGALVTLAGCGSGRTTIAGLSQPLEITAATVSPAVNGVPYGAVLDAAGGTLSYHWQVSSGTLPAGLSLDPATGIISGVPKSTGTASIAVAVSDHSDPVQTISANVTLQVVSQLLLAQPTLADGQVGSSYKTALLASGGTPAYSYSISAGSLPPGLNLIGGTLSGIPTVGGTYSFTVTATDNGAPTQSASIPVSLRIDAPLAISSTSLAAATVGLSYSSSLQATGGTPNYQWTAVGGRIPPGLSFTSAGTLTGTPTHNGTYVFIAAVTDTSIPVQRRTANITVQVNALPLVVTTTTFADGTVGTPYSLTLQVTGGTPAYLWFRASGGLPPGLNISLDGVISGTPTTAGRFFITFLTTDSGSPVQARHTSGFITIAAAPAPPVSTGTTWYVRPDGGTRYSAKMSLGQCDGKSDLAYPGSGVNQSCAFKDARYLWQDGSYVLTPTQSNFPSYGWIGSGGDTYLIRGSIGSGASYRVGYPNNSAPYDAATDQYWGVAGDPYSSGAPPPLSGTAGQHTRILGENYAACHTASAKTQLHGGFGVSAVLDLSGSSYVDVACLDITDFAGCGRASQTNTCSSELGQMPDYATNGIRWSRTSTHVNVTDVHIHGLASAGMIGPTGDGVVLSYVDLIGNAASGWNADLGDGLTGTGSLLVQHYNIAWNGCAEEYPVVDALPYQDCTDDNTGGYGDGFGTATTPSSPAWNVTFDQGVVSYNTQDGLDALHLTGAGSSMTVTRTQAFGNMGQQIKVGGASGTAVNNLITTNCNALRQDIPGVPAGYNSRLSDFCRAADTGVLLTLGANTQLTFDFNTIYSASATGIEIDCDTTGGACDATSKIDFRNNIFVGFLNSNAAGYTNGGSGDYSNPIYNGAGIDFFGNAGSLYTNNATFHPKSNWTCAAPHETHALCGDPGLVDESWHLYGMANMAPSNSSPAIGNGTFIAGWAIDYAGVTRAAPPTIGAMEP